MDASLCVDCLQEAIRHVGKPKIFNSDKGSQLTSDSFTGMLLENHVTISIDGPGRALDNIFVERLWRAVKHKEICLKKHDSLLLRLTKYFMFYNVRDRINHCVKIHSAQCIPMQRAAAQKL